MIERKGERYFYNLFLFRNIILIFCFIVDVESEEKCVENLSQVVKLLPRPIFIVMRYFFAFLNQYVFLEKISC